MIPIARPLVGDEEKAAVLAVLESGQLAHGPVTEAFEREFAAAMGVRHAVAVCNGTVALQAALLAAGIGPGDEVVSTPFTFVATANAIRMVGATPVFADVEGATFNLDPAAVRPLLSARTKAILPVHLYGLPADLAPLLEMAEESGIPLLEDAAQAHGATYGGRAVGGWGAMGVFSLYPTKNMTSGEGGMVICMDEEAAGVLRSLRNHGRSPTATGGYDHVRLGYNFRLTDLGSAVGRVQLSHLASWNEARRRNAAVLDEAVAAHGRLAGPAVPGGRTHVYHQYTVRTQDRAGFIHHLRQAGVGAGVYYPVPLYAYAHLRGFARPCPEAERAAREVVSIPVHAGLSPDELDRVAAAVRSWPGH